MDRKCIIIVSGQDFLYKNICANFHEEIYEIKLFKNKKSIEDFLEDPYRIDAMIIDDINHRNEALSIYARILFTFKDLKLKHQIIIKKPLILADLLSEIEWGLNSSKIFTLLDKNVYCELRSIFTIQDGEVIKLSHLENMVLKHILLSKDFYISKDTLQRNVWKYSKDAQTTTIEQCLNKLRSTLPKGLLGPCERGYKLFTKKIS